MFFRKQLLAAQKRHIVLQVDLVLALKVHAVASALVINLVNLHAFVAQLCLKVLTTFLNLLLLLELALASSGLQVHGLLFG